MGVLTAGSPCAVVLVPLAYVCAVATTTRKGILLRSSAALDDVLSCGIIALDKTGKATCLCVRPERMYLCTGLPQEICLQLTWEQFSFLASHGRHHVLSFVL